MCIKYMYKINVKSGKKWGINMSKQTVKTLGILLAVCFLMSVTAVAVSAAPADNGRPILKAAVLNKAMNEDNDRTLLKAAVLKKEVSEESGCTETERPILKAAVLKKAVSEDQGNVINQDC